jgi:DNA-binding transcriptional MerR regulator
MVVGSMPVTVAQMAELTARQGVSKEAFIQRVRHWTRERLLFPLGETNPGTGKHRVYDDAAVHYALILDLMTDTGIPIAKQRETMEVVQGGLEQRLQGKRAKKAKPLLLIIKTNPGQSQSEVSFIEGKYTIDKRAVRTIVFNITELFAVLRPAATTLSLTTSAPDVSVTTNKKGE